MWALSFFATTDLEESVNQLSLNVVLVASLLLIALIFLSVRVVKNKQKKFKAPLFLAILIVVVGTTLTISGSTIYLNIKSATGGPVHWHADFEIWACDNELELRDPVGLLSNKIGTATLHEHNDKRIHLEGVPVTKSYDASLTKFMTVIGGEISKQTLIVPLNKDKLFENEKGDQDGDGNSAPAPELLAPFVHTDKGVKIASFVNGQACGALASEVQAFVYQYDAKSKTYTQTKLADPADYYIAPQSEVPPGDCIILEFAPVKERTDKLCKQYGLRDYVKCERFGVLPSERKICENTEVR